MLSFWRTSKIDAVSRTAEISIDDENAERFARFARIDAATREELMDVLGDGDVAAENAEGYAANEGNIIKPLRRKKQPAAA